MTILGLPTLTLICTTWGLQSASCTVGYWDSFSETTIAEAATHNFPIDPNWPIVQCLVSDDILNFRLSSYFLVCDFNLYLGLARRCTVGFGVAGFQTFWVRLFELSQRATTSVNFPVVFKQLAPVNTKCNALYVTTSLIVTCWLYIWVVFYSYLWDSQVKFQNEDGCCAPERHL